MHSLLPGVSKTTLTLVGRSLVNLTELVDPLLVDFGESDAISLSLDPSPRSSRRIPVVVNALQVCLSNGWGFVVAFVVAKVVAERHGHED
jgi:hypothetical protein